MNNIHEKDWAEDDGWSCHSGMASNPYDEDDPPKQGDRADEDGRTDAD